MKNKFNKGFTIVEVVIALTIFAILMIPLASSVISSMKKTTAGKELQQRNEFAENLMEYAKEEELSVIQTGDVLKKAGTAGFSFSEDHDKYTKGTEEIPYDTYTASGKVNIGTKHTEYSYIMEISNSDYAKAEKDAAAGATFVNPNHKEFGIVEDLDSSKLALINGTISNYDQSVSNEFLAKKIGYLRQHSPTKYQQYISSESRVDIFSEDRAKRIITIKVKKEPAAPLDPVDKYTVSCTLTYYDLSSVVLDGGKNMSTYLANDPIEYTPYTKTFEEKLPNIYLMYNNCVYNGLYSTKDYIVFDTSEAGDVPVNAFIVQTAEHYSETVGGVLGDSTSSKSLVYNDRYGMNQRNDVDVYIAATKNSNFTYEDNVNGTTVTKSRLKVYHNFGVEQALDAAGNPATDSSGNPIYRPNKKSDKFHFDSIGGLDVTKYKSLAEAETGLLAEASQDERGLYTIKIWMKKTSDGAIDKVNEKPIIEGTKGGSDK